MTNDKRDSLEERLSKLEKRVEDLENASTTTSDFSSVRNPQEKLSINEFLKRKNLGNDVERTLAIAYWLDYYEKVNSFNVSDIENAFRMARFPVPKNINDKVNMNIKNGHIAEDKEKKEGKKTWYVTNTGSEYLENELNKK